MAGHRSDLTSSNQASGAWFDPTRPNDCIDCSTTGTTAPREDTDEGDGSKRNSFNHLPRFNAAVGVSDLFKAE